MEVIKIPTHASLHLSSAVQMQQALDPMNIQHQRGVSDSGAIIANVDEDGKPSQLVVEQIENGKVSLQSDQNWLAPSIKKVSSDSSSRSDMLSSVTVIDEETRMSAESGSRSQTPARNVSAPGIYIFSLATRSFIQIG